MPNKLWKLARRSPAILPKMEHPRRQIKVALQSERKIQRKEIK